jgi:hypothetical protein
MSICAVQSRDTLTRVVETCNYSIEGYLFIQKLKFGFSGLIPTLGV